MRANWGTRSGSWSGAISWTRFQRQSKRCNQRRTVSADTWNPRRTCKLEARVAQLQRVRHQPPAEGALASKANKRRRSAGTRATGEGVSWVSSLCPGLPPWRQQAATS
jgi:hypothetical protein